MTAVTALTDGKVAPSSSGDTRAGYFQPTKSKASEREAVRSGQFIFRQGDPVAAIGEIVSGCVALSLSAADTRAQIVEIVRAGTLLGASCRGRHSVSAKCLSDVTLRWMSLRSFEASRVLQRRAQEQQQRQLDRLRSQVVLLGQASAVERVATLLLVLMEAPAETGALVAPCVQISQQDMANYLGMTHETVCRTVAKLRTSGIIETDRRGHFRIVALERLRDLTQPPALSRL